MLLLNILLIFIIVAAVIALEAKDLLSSVVAVGAGGLGLSICFLVLKAPDLAITQLVVEILILIILIRATINKDLPFSTSGRWFFNTFITFAFLAVFLYIGYVCLNDLPPFGYPLMRVSKFYINYAMDKTHAANVVSSILLNFRGYDTLGEATILFTAVMSVLAIMRKTGRKKLKDKEAKDEF